MKPSLLFALERKKKFTWVGTLLLLVGCLIVFLGVFFPWFIGDQLDNGIKNGLVMKSKDQDGYDKWRANTHSDAVPIYQSYRLWNLTNLEEVKQGAIPEYKEGPLCTYRKYFEKLNVTFLDDSNQVQFGKRNWFVLEESLSPDCDPDAMIYNINPGYVGLMQKAGGEENLAAAMISPTLGGLFSTLFTTLLPNFLVFQASNQKVAALKGMIIQALANETSTPELMFYDIWANFSEPPANQAPLWTLMGLLSLGKGPSQISVDSCKMLFDATYPYSFLNAASFSTWGAAALQQPPALAFLESTFDLTPDQLSAVINWSKNFITRNSIPDLLIKQFQVSKLADIGWLQWGAAAVFNQASVNTVFQLSLAGIPEIYFYQTQVLKSPQPIVFTLSKSQGYLNGTGVSLLETKMMLYFLQLVQRGQFGQISSTWGMSQPEAMVLAGYFLYIRNTFVDHLFTVDVPNEGSGLFVGRTIHEWLWTGSEYVLRLLNQEDGASLQTNNTISPPSTFYTGKSDINLVTQFVNWQGKTVICGKSDCPGSGIWKSNVSVVGTEGSQFRPFLEKQDLLLWNTDVMRPIILEFVEDQQFRGIDLLKYQLSPRLFDPDDLYFQEIYGFANMSSTYGAPIYICKPHFLGVSDYWRERVHGMSPNVQLHDTFISIEPMTGAAMVADKRLQLNIYLPNQTQIFSRYHTNTTTGLFYPIFWGSESAEITEDLASKFKDSVYHNLFIKKVIFYCLVIGGSVIALAGLGLLGYVATSVYINRRYYQYETVP